MVVYKMGYDREIRLLDYKEVVGTIHQQIKRNQDRIEYLQTRTEEIGDEGFKMQRERERDKE